MQNDEQLIRDLLEKWHKASAAGDLDQVLDLMSDDVIYLRAGQPPMRGKQAFAAGFRMVTQHHRFESVAEVKEVRVDGKLAYCWTNLSVKMIPLGAGLPMNLKGNTLSVFEKQTDNKWVMIRDANMLVPG